MVRLRIEEILKEKGMTKYQLNKKLGGMCYRNFNNIVTNQVTSIKFETLDKFSKALDVPVGELFEQLDNTDNDNYK